MVVMTGLVVPMQIGVSSFATIGSQINPGTQILYYRGFIQSGLMRFFFICTFSHQKINQNIQQH